MSYSSEDEESVGSLVDFIVDDEEPIEYEPESNDDLMIPPIKDKGGHESEYSDTEEEDSYSFSDTRSCRFVENNNEDSDYVPPDSLNQTTRMSNLRRSSRTIRNLNGTLTMIL